MTKSHKKVKHGAPHKDSHHEPSAEHKHMEHKQEHKPIGHKHPNHHHKRNNSSLQNWQIMSAVLVILLIASLFTGGFSFSKNKAVNADAISASLVQNGLVSPDKQNQVKTVIQDLISPKKESSKSVSKVDKPLDVELYVMSQCPYGVQAENTMFQAIKDLGEDNFNLNVDYIASPSGNDFNSLHGPNEVAGDKVQLCEKEVDSSKYLDFVLCMNEDPSKIPSNWESCAQKLNIDTDKVKACLNNDQSTTLLTDSAKRSTDAKASGSPTIYVGGNSYSGGRGVNDFKRAFCNAFPSEKPSACDDIPAPKNFEVIVLNDERCADCQAAQASLLGQLKTLFPGMKAKTVDYSSTEGKALFASTNTKYLPAFLFNDDVKSEDNYDKLQRYLVPAGDYSSLMIGASFDPTKEICDNNKDDTGNGKIDCADSDCANSMVCRPAKDKDLQVFIMADCPYGKKAVEALKPVIENFGKDINYEVHYIAGDNGDGTFNSLHGAYEAQEDMTQLCVKEHSPDQWFDYLYCRSMEGIKGHDWHNCAESSGVNVSAVETCLSSGEGANLLKEDIKIASGLGIGASPTWLANNKYTFSGIDSETVKTNYCKYNPDLAGCENTLTSDSGSVPAGSCG